MITYSFIFNYEKQQKKPANTASLFLSKFSLEKAPKIRYFKIHLLKNMYNTNVNNYGTESN